LEIFANFMQFSFFFPEKRREPVLGGLDLPSAKKLGVSPPKAYNAAAGLRRKQTGRKDPLLSATGIALTWAAKPSVSQSLNP
jgi:hypothetical protein